MYDITAQAVGYLGLIFGILAYQSNTHKKILLTKAASELFLVFSMLCWVLMREC